MAGNAANGKTPAVFDLEAASLAATNEAEAVPFAFTYKGQSYEVPPSTTWPISALRAISAGDLDGALPELLGAEQYEQLAASGLRVGELSILFERIAAHSGLGSLPNSGPPQRHVSTRT